VIKCQRTTSNRRHGSHLCRLKFTGTPVTQPATPIFEVGGQYSSVINIYSNWLAVHPTRSSSRSILRQSR
jgi:hypothetical protein